MPKYKHQLILLICALFIFPTTPLHAQDDNSGDGYTIALERIEEAGDSNATFLNLTELGLTELPPELFELTNLEVLRLGNNQLSELPTEIGQLTNLQELGLSDNQLSELPSEIGQLTNLRWLYLSNNELSNLPLEIINFSNLQWLYLDDNQLANLPELSNVQVLYLQNNQFTTIPRSLGYMPNLGHIDITGNPLVFPPSKIANQGTPAILDFLRHPPPYPPHHVGWTAIAVLILTTLTTIISAYAYLRHLRTSERNS